MKAHQITVSGVTIVETPRSLDHKSQRGSSLLAVGKAFFKRLLLVRYEMKQGKMFFFSPENVTLFSNFERIMLNLVLPFYIGQPFFLLFFLLFVFILKMV